MRSVFAASSKEDLSSICAALAHQFSLPPFRMTRQSEHLATAASQGESLGFTVTEYFGFISSDEAERIGPPDFWNLAWRASAGEEFNFQVVFNRDPEVVSRQKARGLKQRLRPIFEVLRLHGDPPAV